MKQSIDGLIYEVDDETGEILSVQPEAPKFVVDDADKAEWVLKRLQEQDAALDAIAHQKQAILDNLSTMESRINSKRTGLLFRFKQELEDFARANLPAGKKSWVCAYGTVQFRSSPARLKVSDPAIALEWARSEAIHAIKVSEEFQISKLTPEEKDHMMEHVPSGFDVTPASETVDIKTGV